LFEVTIKPNAQKGPHLLDLLPMLVVDAVRDQQAALVNPRVSMQELLGLFERLGLVETVPELRRAGIGGDEAL
jgi:hypothetical protein